MSVVRRIALPVEADGSLGRRWGRARLVAVASVEDGGIAAWSVHDVGWDTAHDEGTEGSHHARVAGFLREHGVDTVAVDHVGEGMARMLATMGVAVVPVATGDARAAAIEAAART
ncbi:MAG: hypothetical protein GC157_12395 [Frankiales bacterium]|nr:hypothetical protein [Frankiales bacterium]